LLAKASAASRYSTAAIGANHVPLAAFLSAEDGRCSEDASGSICIHLFGRNLLTVHPLARLAHARLEQTAQRRELFR